MLGCELGNYARLRLDGSEASQALTAWDFSGELALEHKEFELGTRCDEINPSALNSGNGVKSNQTELDKGYDARRHGYDGRRDDQCLEVHQSREDSLPLLKIHGNDGILHAKRMYLE